VQRSSKCLALAAALIIGTHAHAALVTLSGTSVDFIIDDAQPGLAIYGGLPTVVGDSLLFFPSTFRAQSNNGAGVVAVNGTVNFQIVSRNGNLALNTIAVSEFGDYFNTPGAGGSVSAVAQLGAVNLMSSNPPASFRQDIAQTGPLTADGANTWDLVTDINFRQVWLNPTSRVQIDIQNNLSATSIANFSESWIQKKFQGMVVDVQVVPLPAAFWLLASALGSLFGVSRWRGAQRTLGAPVACSA
jgi:hypothetical protein